MVNHHRLFTSTPLRPTALKKIASFVVVPTALLRTGQTPNPDFRYTLPINQSDTSEPLTLQTSTGDEQVFYRIGSIEFEVEGEPAKLALYKSQHHDELFLPFRDATSGSETYGAGRYLEPEELSNGQVLVDFNLSYNPFCAYSEAYSCPLPPFENHLTTVAIRAGEKAYKK